MNSIHDLGGMHGFGPIEIEDDEPVFHEDWEGIVYAAHRAGLGNGIYNLDEFRHSIERMDPAKYLASSYYERWLTGLERLLIEKQILTVEELESSVKAISSGDRNPTEKIEPDRFEAIFAGLMEAYETRDTPKDPSFDQGDRVRVRNRHPAGHTRCPRYVRGATGTIVQHRGTMVLPDANAHGEPQAEPVYTVRFSGYELWGDDAERSGNVHLDMWESYVETPRCDSE